MKAHRLLRRPLGEKAPGPTPKRKISGVFVRVNLSELRRHIAANYNSLTAFADRCRLDKSSVSLILREKRRVSLGSYEKLQRGFPGMTGTRYVG